MTPTPAAADWRRNQAAVTFATFMGFAGFTLVMPFLPLYFESLGLHETSAIAIWSGLTLGVTPAVTAAMAPVWARVADRYGRKLMVARSLLSFVVIMALTAAVRAPWQVFALRAIQGFFAGYSPIAMTMAAESSPREHMAAAIGWVQTAQRLGPAVGPIIGGTLAETVGLRETFVVAAGFYLVAFAFVVFGYREVPRARPDGVAAAKPAATFAELRRMRPFLLSVGTIFALQLIDRSFGPVLPLYLRGTGAADAKVPFLSGVIFTVMAAAAASGNQACQWLLERWPAAGLLPVATVAAACGTIAFGFGPPLVVLLLASAVLGVGLGIATTTAYTVGGHAVPAAARGVAFAYLTGAYLVGLAVSPVVSGFIGAADMRAVFLGDTAVLAVVAWTVRSRMTRAAPAD